MPDKPGFGRHYFAYNPDHTFWQRVDRTLHIHWPRTTDGIVQRCRCQAWRLDSGRWHTRPDRDGYEPGRTVR